MSKHYSNRAQEWNDIQLRIKNFYAMPINRAVVYLREGDKKTFVDIAQIMGLSKTYVERIYKKETGS